MKTSNVLFSKESTSSSVIYKVMQNIENNRKRKKLTLYFKVTQDNKGYKNSITFYNIESENDKWWKNNNTILRLNDALSSVSKVQDFKKLDISLVKRYIFIQALGIAFPEFKNKDAFISKLKNKYLNSLKEINLDFRATVYKNSKVLCLINPSDFITLRHRTRDGILRAIASKDSNSVLEDSLERLPYYKTYEEIRTKLAKKALKEFSEKDNILKTANDKKEAFLEALSNILMPHEQKIRIYEEMCDAFKPVFSMYKNKISRGHIAIRESLREAVYKNDLKKLFSDLTSNKTDLKRKHFVAIVAGFIEAYLKFIKVYKKDREHNKQIVAKLAKLVQSVLKYKKEIDELNKLYLELKQGYKEIRKENENLKHKVSVLEKKLKIA